MIGAGSVLVSANDCLARHEMIWFFGHWRF